MQNDTETRPAVAFRALQLLTGTVKGVATDSEGRLASFPRFHGAALDHNLQLTVRAQALAADKRGCTPRG
ncbi:hypothetical protein MY10362_005652 [Beauveria mimosiformis]